MHFRIAFAEEVEDAVMINQLPYRNRHRIGGGLRQTAGKVQVPVSTQGTNVGKMISCTPFHRESPEKFCGITEEFTAVFQILFTGDGMPFGSGLEHPDKSGDIQIDAAFSGQCGDLRQIPTGVFQGEFGGEVMGQSAPPDCRCQRNTLLRLKHFCRIIFRPGVRIDIVVMAGEDIPRRHGTGFFGTPFHILIGSPFRVDRQPGGISGIKSGVIPPRAADEYTVEAFLLCGGKNLFCGPVARHSFRGIPVRIERIKTVRFFNTLRAVFIENVMFPEDGTCDLFHFGVTGGFFFQRFDHAEFFQPPPGVACQIPEVRLRFEKDKTDLFRFIGKIIVEEFCYDLTSGCGSRVDFQFDHPIRFNAPETDTALRGKVAVGRQGVTA